MELIVRSKFLPRIIFSCSAVPLSHSLEAFPLQAHSEPHPDSQAEGTQRLINTELTMEELEGLKYQSKESREGIEDNEQQRIARDRNYEV